MEHQVNWAFWIAGQARVVPLAYGIPGVAKTASCRSLAQRANRRFLGCYLDQMLPEDMGGVPAPTRISIGDVEHDCIKKLLDETMLRAQLEPSVVLLDELNQASHSMMAAAQEWINSPPESCWMFAAANPVEQASNGVDLTPPLVNRMCVVTWERPVEARREGWRRGFRDYPAPQVPLLPDDYLDIFGGKWGELLCAFEDQHADLFGDDAFPKDLDQATKPWPSDRSWTNVGILLSAGESVGANATTRHNLIAGCVGDAAAQQFERWLAAQDLPDPEELLAMPHTLKLPVRFDMSRAIVASIIGRLRANCTPARWESAYDLLEVAFRQQQEVALSAEGAVWKLKPDGHLPKERNGAAAEMRKARLEA